MNKAEALNLMDLAARLSAVEILTELNVLNQMASFDEDFRAEIISKMRQALANQATRRAEERMEGDNAELLAQKINLAGNVMLDNVAHKLQLGQGRKGEVQEKPDAED